MTSIVCDKHGHIEDTAFHIQYIDRAAGGILKKKVYCLECISEMLDYLMKDAPKVKVTDVTN